MPAESVPSSGSQEGRERFLARVREVARECGYAVAVHGSGKRDLDLIAAPWISEAQLPAELVARLCRELALGRKPDHKAAADSPSPWPESKPHGRLGWALVGVEGDEVPDPCFYVDISVFGPTPEQEEGR